MADDIEGNILMEIAIVDDEKIICDEIKKRIKKIKPCCHADEYARGEDLLFADKLYNIVFLDIQLEGRNGIDIAEELQQKSENTIVIFVTGIKDYVFQAFDVAAFHYLLKPIDAEKFEEVFLRAWREAEKRKGKETGLLLVRTRNRTFPLPKGSIFYVESRGKKAEIHTARETVSMYASLNSLQAELGEGFYRSHRGYLVNMAYVSEYYHDSILLTNGERVYMAKEKYQEFVREYMHYLRGGGVIHG